ncbi:uncharacterized protein [Ptychodera flava]|uniref:uncharacterized protein n=1 Tax=Ptychodera flava TaxID=63121 RepID=UPI00396A6F80
MKAVWCFLCIVMFHYGKERMTAWSDVTSPQLGRPPNLGKSFQPLSLSGRGQERRRQRRDSTLHQATASFQTKSLERTTTTGSPTTIHKWPPPRMPINPTTLQCRTTDTDRLIGSCLSYNDINCVSDVHVRAIIETMTMCSCRPECVIYGGCCHDYQEVCPGKSKEFENLADSKRCMESGSKYGGMMVTYRCPKDWHDDVVRSKCEDSKGETILGATLAVKANGSDQSLYRNIYCGICHGVNMTDLWFGKLKWECPPDVQNVIHFSETDIIGVISRLRALPSCKLLPVLPESHDNINFYCQYYVDTCPEGSDGTLVELCQNHTAKVSQFSIRRTVFYKNVHCALCNDLDLNKDFTFCGVPQSLQIPIRFFTLDVVIDFDVQGNYNMTIDGTPSRHQFTCGDGKVFDIFTENCISVDPLRPQQSNLTRPIQRNDTGVLSASLLTLHIEFSSPNNFLPIAKLESTAEMIVNILYQNSASGLALLELKMLQSSSSTGVAFVYSVVVDSVTLRIILRDTCAETWQELASSFVELQITAIGISFKQTRSYLCNDKRDQIVLNTTNVIRYNGTFLTSPRSNFSQQSPYNHKQLKYRACQYEKAGGGLVSITSTLGLCSSNHSNMSCPEGVIIKVRRQDFQIVGEDIVYRSLRYTAKEYFLSEKGLHAFLCHIDKKRSFLWDVNIKTYPKKLLVFSSFVLSIGCLLVTIVVIALFKDMRDSARKISILNLTIALLIAQVIFITVVHLVKFKAICNAASILSHYIWLVAFCWVGVVSFDLAYHTKQLTAKKNDRLVRIYCLFAWLLPFLFVAGCVLIDMIGPYDLKIGYSEGPVCWISRRIPLIVVFVAPVALILLFNVICLVFTIAVLCKSEVQLRKHRSKSFTTHNVVFAMEMTTIMSLAWTLGLVDSFVQSDLLDLVYIPLNGLQGLSIFVATVLNRSTFKLLRETCCKSANR